MAVHRLKTWPEPFDAMRLGLKGFEFRREDGRIFEVGDLLCLEQYDPELSRHTGEFLWRLVTFVLGSPHFGVPKGFAVLSIALVDQADMLGIEIDPADLQSLRFYEAEVACVVL